MEFSGFEWDHGNSTKCRKHGVSLDAIEALLRSGVTILPDAAHSKKETRYRAVGRTERGRAIFVVFTLRERGGGVLLRPISARYMHKEEADHFAKTYET